MGGGYLLGENYVIPHEMRNDGKLDVGLVSTRTADYLNRFQLTLLEVNTEIDVALHSIHTPDLLGMQGHNININLMET
jgi:hypothetical protein